MKKSSDNFGAHTMRRWRRRPLGRYRYVRLRWRIFFTLIDHLGYGILYLINGLRQSIMGPQKKPIEQQCKSIMLVQLDHLGDAVITTAILPALRQHYPTARIEVLCSPQGREIFEAIPQVDRVEISRINRFSRGKLARLAWIPAIFWWALRLRQRHFDLGIDVRGDFPIALLLWLAGIRRRLGWACGGGGFMLTDCARFVHNRPENESRWALVEKLNIFPPPTPDARAPLFSCKVQKFHNDFPASHGNSPRPNSWTIVGEQPTTMLTSSCPIRIVIHPGAGTSAKRWPETHWKELLGRILAAHHAQVVLVGGVDDQIWAKELLGRCPWPSVFDLTGKIDIPKLASTLRNADIFVGADSGPAHLAAAVGAPTVVLFSGTNSPQQWKPHGLHVCIVRHEVDCSPCHRGTCPHPDHPCMTLLSPATVAGVVDRLITTISNTTPSAFSQTKEFSKDEMYA